MQMKRTFLEPGIYSLRGDARRVAAARELELARELDARGFPGLAEAHADIADWLFRGLPREERP